MCLYLLRNYQTAIQHLVGVVQQNGVNNRKLRILYASFSLPWMARPYVCMDDVCDGCEVLLRYAERIMRMHLLQD